MHIPAKHVPSNGMVVKIFTHPENDLDGDIYVHLKSTCDVNLLSKLSIIFKDWRVIVLCTFKVPQGANNLILCTLDTIHRPFLFQD